MNETWDEYLAPDEQVQTLQERRSGLVLWVLGRFRRLLAENRVDDALYFMDEWFEWVNKDTYINESTLFFDGHELRDLYEHSKG